MSGRQRGWGTFLVEGITGERLQWISREELNFSEEGIGGSSVSLQGVAWQWLVIGERFCVITRMNTDAAEPHESGTQGMGDLHAWDFLR
jgi:hypothetical protein